jgi:hypothetical protein
LSTPFEKLEVIILLLQTGMEAFDRMKAAAAQIESDGQTIADGFGQAQLLAALKSLNLDLEPLRDGPGSPGGK